MQKNILSLIASIVAPLCIYFFVEPSGALTTPIIIFLAVTLWAVIAWATEPVDSAAVAVVLPVLYFLLVPGVSLPKSMMGWTSGVTLICIGGFILARVLSDTGLGQRIALVCINASGGTFLGTLLAIALASTIIAPFIPTLAGKVVMFSVIGIGFCEALGLEKKSTNATALMLTILVACGAARIPFITGALDNAIATSQMGKTFADAIASGILPAGAAVDISFGAFFLHGIVPGILFMAASIALIFLVLRPEKTGNMKEIARQKLEELGPVSAAEKKLQSFFCCSLSVF